MFRNLFQTLSESEMPDHKIPLDKTPLSRMKHPLRDSWTFWYLKPLVGVKWEDSQLTIYDVGTVEDFWAAYNSMHAISEMRPGCDYSFFKVPICTILLRTVNLTNVT